MEYGRALVANSQWPEAVSALTRATQLTPDGLQGWQLLGRAQLASGQRDEANKSMERFRQVESAQKSNMTRTNEQQRGTEDPIGRNLEAAMKLASQGQVENALGARGGFYVASLSSRTVVYKGLVTPAQLPLFYTDLGDPRLASALALVHSRFSTNTFPTWARAHPYRYLCHNGEINTLRGNQNWMRVREGNMRPGRFGDDLQKLYPLVGEDQSDSACVDNVLEFLVHGGRSLPHAGAGSCRRFR